VEAESAQRFSGSASLLQDTSSVPSEMSMASGARPNTAETASSTSTLPGTRAIGDTSSPPQRQARLAVLAKSSQSTSNSAAESKTMKLNRSASARTTTTTRVPVQTHGSRISTLNRTNAPGLATGTTIEVGFAPIRHVTDLNHLHPTSGAPELSGHDTLF
jgi:hypothetical protein